MLEHMVIVVHRDENRLLDRQTVQTSRMVNIVGIRLGQHDSLKERPARRPQPTLLSMLHHNATHAVDSKTGAGRAGRVCR